MQSVVQIWLFRFKDYAEMSFHVSKDHVVQNAWSNVMYRSDSCAPSTARHIFLRDINNRGRFRGVFCPESFVVIIFLNTTSFRRELNYREELLNPELTKLTGPRSPSFFSFSVVFSSIKRVQTQKVEPKKKGLSVISSTCPY